MDIPTIELYKKLDNGMTDKIIVNLSDWEEYAARGYAPHTSQKDDDEPVRKRARKPKEAITDDLL